MDALLKGLPLTYLAACDYRKTGKNWQAILPASSLVAAAQRLFKAGYFLEDIGALDCVEGYVVTYHFAPFETAGRVAIRAIAPHAKPVLPSIAHVFHGAEWHERETRDFHGVVFEGNPNLVPLLMDPDMADCFPLRKDEKARARMRDILEIGEVRFCAPGFDLMTPEAPAEAAAKPAGDAATA
ncbi:MAG: NADH-quinone oxidoreductase subunit C [Desulfovibrio sp.]|jgi:NADH-quinone oxidoreductase subunit C|nr:NADH-quinone oxidoreductase subunit C [Desulfovibrio sp.]